MDVRVALPTAVGQKRSLQHRAMLRRAALVLMLAATLGGCASVAPRDEAAGDEAVTAGRITRTPVVVAGSEVQATWYLPRADASALVLMQHGFSRRCENLRETSRRLMQASLMVLCLDASMAGGNEALAASLADALVGDRLAPPGGAVPQRIIVGGHSAGARFSVSVGARLDASAPQRLAGALLFDPVATVGFEEQLLRISDAGRRPVFALLAAPHGCNAQGNALPALRQARQAALDAGRESFVVLTLGVDSTHVDVEGEDGDWIGTAACGNPTPATVAWLRQSAAAWAEAVAAGVAPGPPEAQPGKGRYAID